MTDVKKSMKQQLAELEEREGINIAELRARGAAARLKAAAMEKEQKND